jgi:hypothetical protein
MFDDILNEKYTASTHTVIFQGKPITITDHTPVLSPGQRVKRKREIEAALYNVFKKYTDTERKNA